jgi:hypothetical protein
MQDQITALEEEETLLGVSGLGIRLSERLSINIDRPWNYDEVSSHRHEALTTLEGAENEDDDVPPPYETGLPPRPYQLMSPGELVVSTQKLHGHPDRRGRMLSAAASSDQSYSTPRATASPSTVNMPKIGVSENRLAILIDMASLIFLGCNSALTTFLVLIRYLLTVAAKMAQFECTRC